MVDVSGGREQNVVVGPERATALVGLATADVELRVIVEGVGPVGPQGPTILTGTAAPTSGVGAEGQFYLDTTAHILYGPKSGTSWPIALKGAP